MRTLHSALFLLLLSIWGQFSEARAADTADAPRPNVLFLFADDQRADTIAALGNPVIRTPNLDRLVRSGVAFNRAYMQGSMQPATCVPSRAMLLSWGGPCSTSTKSSSAMRLGPPLLERRATPRS